MATANILGTTKIEKPYATSADNWPENLMFGQASLFEGTDPAHLVIMTIVAQDSEASVITTGLNLTTFDGSSPNFVDEWSVGSEWTQIDLKQFAGLHYPYSSQYLPEVVNAGMQISCYYAKASEITNNIITPLDSNGSAITRPDGRSSWYILLTTYTGTTVKQHTDGSSKPSDQTTNFSALPFSTTPKNAVIGIASIDGGSDIRMFPGAERGFVEEEKFVGAEVSSLDFVRFVIDSDEIIFPGFNKGSNEALIRSFDKTSYAENGYVVGDSVLASTPILDIKKQSDTYVWYLQVEKTSILLNNSRRIYDVSLVKYNTSTKTVAHKISNIVQFSNSNISRQNNIAIAFGSVWIIDGWNGNIKKVNPTTYNVSTISLQSGVLVKSDSTVYANPSPHEIIATDSEIWFRVSETGAAPTYTQGVVGKDSIFKLNPSTEDISLVGPSFTGVSIKGQMCYYNGKVYYLGSSNANIYGDYTEYGFAVETDGLVFSTWFSRGADIDNRSTPGGNIFVSDAGDIFIGLGDSRSGSIVKYKIDANNNPVAVVKASALEDSELGLKSAGVIDGNVAYFSGDGDIETMRSNTAVAEGHMPVASGLAATNTGLVTNSTHNWYITNRPLPGSYVDTDSSNTTTSSSPNSYRPNTQATFSFVSTPTLNTAVMTPSTKSGTLTLNTSGLSAGDPMFIWAAGSSSTNPINFSTPPGWTRIGSERNIAGSDGFDHAFAVWWKPYQVGDTSVSMSYSGTDDDPLRIPFFLQLKYKRTSGSSPVSITITPVEDHWGDEILDEDGELLPDPEFPTQTYTPPSPQLQYGEHLISIISPTVPNNNLPSIGSSAGWTNVQSQSNYGIRIFEKKVTNGDPVTMPTLTSSINTNWFSTTFAITFAPVLSNASFTATPTSGPPPLAVTFNSSASTNVTTRSWDFGDGSTSTSQNPTHTYQNIGNYQATLTVTNAYGDTSSMTKTIIVKPVWYITKRSHSGDEFSISTPLPSVPSADGVKLAVDAGDNIWLFTSNSSNYSKTRVIVVEKYTNYVIANQSLSDIGYPVCGVYDGSKVWLGTRDAPGYARDYSVNTLTLSGSTVLDTPLPDLTAAINVYSIIEIMDMDYAEGYVWVATGGGDESIGGTANRVWKVNSNSVYEELPLPVQYPSSLPGFFLRRLTAIKVHDGHIWVSDYENGYVAISDAEAGYTKYSLTTYQSVGGERFETSVGAKLTYSSGAMWASAGNLHRIDPDTARITNVYYIPASYPSIASDGTNMWGLATVTAQGTNRNALFKYDSAQSTALERVISYNISGLQPTTIILEKSSNFTFLPTLQRVYTNRTRYVPVAVCIFIELSSNQVGWIIGSIWISS